MFEAVAFWLATLRRQLIEIFTDLKNFFSFTSLLYRGTVVLATVSSLLDALPAWHLLDLPSSRARARSIQ